MKRIILFLIITVCSSRIHSQGWTEQNASGSSPLTSVSALSSQVCWIGGNSGTVLRTSDGGTTWLSVGGGPLGISTVYTIAGIDSATAVCSITPSATTFIFRTSNGGTSWVPVFSQSGGFINDIKMYSSTGGYAYGNPVFSRWSLWRTTNAGVSWDSTSLILFSSGGENGAGNGMYIDGSSRLWFCTNNTRIYFTTNSGTNWFYGITASVPSIVSVAFNGNTGFCGTSSLSSPGLTSTDGGFNWTAAALPGIGFIRSITNVGARFWYVRDSEIYYSPNNGGSFTLQYFASAGVYSHMSFVLSPLDNMSTIVGWSVRSNHGISKYEESLSSIESENESTPKGFKMHQNYPNPFNPGTVVSYQLPVNGFVSLKIYEVLGKEIEVLVNEELKAGTYEIQWDASNYPSGVYFYRLAVTGENSERLFDETKAMVLLR